MRPLDQLRREVGIVDRPVQEATTTANVGVYTTPIGMLPQALPISPQAAATSPALTLHTRPCIPQPWLTLRPGGGGWWSLGARARAGVASASRRSSSSPWSTGGSCTRTTACFSVGGAFSRGIVNTVLVPGGTSNVSSPPRTTSS